MGLIAQIDLDGIAGWEYVSTLGANWAVAGDAGVEYQYGTKAWGNRPAGFDADAYWLSVNDGSPTMQATFNMTATPMPGAAWLLGSSLIGLVGLRRKFSA